MPDKNQHTRRQRQNAQVRKPEIVRSFYRTILEYGFEGASIARVAARVDIHPSLILHYFKNKENLTLALVDYVTEAYAGLFDNPALDGLSPQARLESLLEIIWSREYDEKIDVAGSFSIIAVAFRNARIREKIERLYSDYKRLLAKELQHAMDAGVIESQNAMQAAARIIAIIEGVRHFRYFLVTENETARFRRDMKAITRKILGAEE